MGGHGVPHTAGGQFGHTHLQLTSGQHLIDNHLVDIALVRHFQTSHVGHHGILLRDLLAGILSVGCGRVEVEFGWLVRIFRAEHHVAVATADVKCLLEVELELLVAHLHGAGSTDIEDANLAAGGEERCLQRVDSLEFQSLVYGHGTADDHAVVHRIDHVHLIFGKHSLNEKVAADALGVITFCVLRMSRITYFIICFHNSVFLSFDLFGCKDTNYFCMMPLKDTFLLQRILKNMLKKP